NTVAGLDEFKAGSDRVAAAGLLFGRQSQIWLTQLEKLAPALSGANWSQTEALVNGLGLSMEDAKKRAEEWNNTLGTLELAMMGIKVQVGDALLPLITKRSDEVSVLAKNGELKEWAQDAAKAMLDLGIAVAEVVNFVAAHNQAVGAALIVIGGGMLWEGESIAARAAGAAAMVSGYEMIGASANKTAAGVKAGTDSMIADMKKLHDEMGMSSNVPALGATSIVGPEKTFNVPSAEEKKAATEAANFKHSYDDLVASLNQGVQAQNALAASYAQGNLATDRARIAAAGLADVQKVLTEAEKTHQQVSAQELALVQGLGEAQERAKIAAADDKAVKDALASATEEYNVKLLTEKERVEQLIDPLMKVREEQQLLTDVYQRGMISADEYAKGQLAVTAAGKAEAKD